MTTSWFWFLTLVLTPPSRWGAGRGALGAMCPPHPACPERLFASDDCYKYLFRRFLLTYTFSFDDTCPKNVYSLFETCNLPAL